MTKRRFMFLVVWITVLCVVPTLAFAGAGGTPPAPGAAAAGSTSAYCCQTWTPTTISDGKTSSTVLEGTTCTAIDDTASARNSCGVANLKAAKCRGEIYSPGAIPSTVQRCFSP